MRHSRLHLDIETDDLAVEVQRMETPDARQQRPRGDGAWVTQDPCGNQTCVIAPETPRFPDRAHAWPSV